MRLGELTRTDDGLLGFFVDDDFEHLHLVDRVVAALAKPAGPEGHLSEEPAPIEHPLPGRPRTRSRSTSASG